MSSGYDTQLCLLSVLMNDEYGFSDAFSDAFSDGVSVEQWENVCGNVIHHCWCGLCDYC